MYVMTRPADSRTMEDDPSDDVFGTDSQTDMTERQPR